MATHTLDLTGLLAPDPTNTTNPCYWQPSSILDTNDLHDGIPVLVFPDGAVKVIASCAFRMPDNYVGTPKFLVRWKASATAGNVVWDVDINSRAVGESLDPSGYDESETVTDAVAGTTELLSECEVTPTPATFAAGDQCLVSVARDGTDASDTMADEAELVGFFFQYADA